MSQGLPARGMSRERAADITTVTLSSPNLLIYFQTKYSKQDNGINTFFKIANIWLEGDDVGDTTSGTIITNHCFWYILQFFTFSLCSVSGRGKKICICFVPGYKANKTAAAAFAHLIWSVIMRMTTLSSHIHTHILPVSVHLRITSPQTKACSRSRPVLKQFEPTTWWDWRWWSRMFMIV